MTSAKKTLSKAMGDKIYYRYLNITAHGSDQELVVMVDMHEATVSIEGGRKEASASLTLDEIRKLAGALLDAADAIENARRTGFIKQKRLI